MRSVQATSLVGRVAAGGVSRRTAAGEDGTPMGAEDRIEQARLRYERAVFGGDPSGLADADRDLDGVEADLALARGRILHARFLADGEEDPRELPLFERAAALHRALGDVRGEGEALFWVGVFHQVVRGDDAGRSALEASAALARQAGDLLTLSYALRHLGVSEHMAGRLGPAREHLEESTRLRREIGFGPGVAANLVGLVHIAVTEGRRDDAATLVAEAHAIALDSGAAGVLPSIEEARARLS